MSLAARRVGLECEPKPCTPPVSGSQQLYFTGSTQPANPVNIGASTLEIVSGHVISGTTPADVAMVSAQAGWVVIIGALAAGVVVAVLASTATTWLIGRIRPAEVLRGE